MVNAYFKEKMKSILTKPKFLKSTNEKFSNVKKKKGRKYDRNY